MTPPEQDVPPAPSPGGASAADDFVKRARGKASGSKPGRGSAPRVEPEAPTEQTDKAKLTPQWKVLREGLLELYTGAQMVAFMADPFAAELIGQNKERCADAWIDLAKQDTRVAKLLRKITTGAGWGAVFAAHLPILLPIMMRRGILPGGALFNGAPFNAMADQAPNEGPAPFPPDDLFNGTVNFGGNGSNGVSE